MKSGELDPITWALDSVIDEYSTGDWAILGTEAERRRELYKARDGRIKQWTRQRTCIFRGCDTPSIRRSHAIQKSGPLTAVSRNSIVLTPQFEYEVGELRLVERGISRASVFPGFCSTHEGMFASFERRRNLEGVDALWLQAYRTACREVVRLEVELASLESMIADYTSLRNQRLLAAVRLRLPAELTSRKDFALRDLDVANDPFIAGATQRVDDFRAVLEELRSHHLTEIETMAVGGSQQDIGPDGIVVDRVLPVTLSGLGSFYVQDQGRLRRVLALLGVYPTPVAMTTTVTMCGRGSDAAIIAMYLGRVDSGIDLLNMVECWMIRGTDHWFLDPAVWSQKAGPQQQGILREMMDFGKGITHDVPFSVFDDLRRTLLVEGESTLPPGVVDRERLKMR